MLGVSSECGKGVPRPLNSGADVLCRSKPSMMSPAFLDCHGSIGWLDKFQCNCMNSVKVPGSYFLGLSHFHYPRRVDIDAKCFAHVICPYTHWVQNLDPDGVCCITISCVFMNECCA